MIRVSKEPTVPGATVTGLSLDQDLGGSDVALLQEALAEHQVLLFLDIDYSHQGFQALAEQFGSIQRHPFYPNVENFPGIMVLDNDRENPSRIDEWHTDMTFLTHPSQCCFLAARVMPDNGGDTLFSSLTAAWMDLPRSLRDSLEGLTATHSFAHGFRESLASADTRDTIKTRAAENPPVVHPVVRTHPVTGQKIAFVNPIFTMKINEISQEESEDLLQQLNEHHTQEKYHFRASYPPDSMVLWDNRAVLHKPVNDYWPARRRVERISINDPLPPA